MNSESPWKQLTEFIVRLQQTVETKPSAPFFQAITSSEVFFTRAELGGLMFSRDEASEYRRCIKAIHESVGGEHGRISRSAVEDAAQIAILKALDANGKDSERDFASRLRREVEGLRQALKRAPYPYIVYLQVCGLDAKDLPRQIGNVKFFIADESNVPGLKPGNHEEKPDDEAAEKRREGVRTLRENVIASIKAKTYSTIEVEAFDKEAAAILAEKELRMTLDVLNYFGDFFSHEGARVFLPGDAAPSRHVGIIENKNDIQDSNYSFSFRGPIMPFSFPTSNSDPRSVGALHKASSLLQKRSRNRWDARILAALRWAGRASVEEGKEEALVLFCISLEALLLTNADKELAYQFALRGAHLLGKEGSRRKEVFGDLKALYNTRSKIVHSGKTEIFAIDLAKANVLAKNAIFIVLTTEPFSRFTSEKEFNDWVEEQTLTGVGDTTRPESAGE